MSPPKGGYGGIVIPSDPPRSDGTEGLLRSAVLELKQARRQFEEASAKIEELTKHVRSLETELGILRGEQVGINAKLAKQGEDVATILLLQSAAKSAWNQFGKHVIAYGLALFAGGWGVSKATEKPPAPTQVIQQRSAIGELIDQCRAKPDFPANNLGVTPQMECLIRISREQFIPR